jgi:hypothetical protein
MRHGCPPKSPSKIDPEDPKIFPPPQGGRVRVRVMPFCLLPEKSVKIFYSNIETLKTQGIWASNFQDT